MIKIQNKAAPHKINTLLLAALFCALTPAPVFAQTSEQARPKHIKMNESAKKQSDSQAINIINSPYAELKSAQKENKESQPPQSKVAAPLTISARNNDKSDCPFSTGSGTLAAKHLAGSLRFYLKDQGLDPSVIDAMYDASIAQNVDFGILALSAMLESEFGSNTISASSSARGMFQFIDSTWLILIHKYGKRIGLNAESDSLYLDQKTGRIEVKENSRITRESILDLRNDYRIIAMIKAFHLKEEEQALTDFGITAPHATDYYIVHMLGTGFAQKFYEMKNQNASLPLAQSGITGAEQAANNNPYFFFAASKTQPLTAAQSYGRYYTHVLQAISRLNGIEDQYGIGPDSMIFRAPCATG